MTITEIQQYIEEIEKDAFLLEGKAFDKRTDVIDFIDFQLMERLNTLLQTNTFAEIISLKTRAEKLVLQLEEIDKSLFKKLRQEICIQKIIAPGFLNILHEYIDFDIHDSIKQQEAGYDNLDIFINGLISAAAIPAQSKTLEPGMVFYQKTPARIILELVEKANFKPDDVFIDLGSGLGQATILVHLLTGITAKGIEYEPAFCDYANNCAAELNLQNVTFINADARETDYTEGTVFFMFTPFLDAILSDVMKRLRNQTAGRKIKLFTYGPLTAQILKENWLTSPEDVDNNLYKLAMFTNIPA
ncbi:MAG: hypothetical protein EOP53_16905 [Sphingobacteriales bacterium]|nr:MAG: hypothetical protein EOP53_16905 [Sphingobacteriales bacterium]